MEVDEAAELLLRLIAWGGKEDDDDEEEEEEVVVINGYVSTLNSNSNTDTIIYQIQRSVILLMNKEKVVSRTWLFEKTQRPQTCIK